MKGIKQFRFNAKDMRSIWDMAEAKDMPKDTQRTIRYAIAGAEAEAEPAINVQISSRLD